MQGAEALQRGSRKGEGGRAGIWEESIGKSTCAHANIHCPCLAHMSGRQTQPLCAHHTQGPAPMCRTSSVWPAPKMALGCMPSEEVRLLLRACNILLRGVGAGGRAAPLRRAGPGGG